MDNAKTKDILKKFAMVIALVFIWILFAILTKGIFLKARNLSNLFRQMSIYGFLACGMLFVIVTGGIDLSVGSVTGFISAFVALMQVKVMPNILMNMMPGDEMMAARGVVSTLITVGLAVIVGILIGLQQGSIISYLGVPAFIVTLGGMQLYRGGQLAVTNGQTIVPIEKSTVWLAQGYVDGRLGIVLMFIVIALIFIFTLNSRRKKVQYDFEVPPMYVDIIKASLISAVVAVYVIVMNSYKGIQIPVLLLSIAAIILSYLGTNTRFGRYVYALGGNMEATRLSGIDIKKHLMKVHILMGVMCSFAGIILTGYVAAGTMGGGFGYELEAIAACVIGGTSLAGGAGTIVGTLVGAMVMASITNGMSVMSLAPHWQYFVKGAVLVGAVYFDVVSKKKKI